MLSYHNDPAVKEKSQLRFAEHRAADSVIQGTGYENGRGCFVGCTLKRYDHSQFPIELGWPEWLARLADSIFEGIPKAEAPQFGTDLLAAVPVGVDLEPVRWMLAIARHRVQLERLKDNTEPYAEQVRDVLNGVIAHAEAMLGKTYESESAESAARSAARSAAESAARSAESAARSAAQSAAQSAARSAESAAWSAARSAARSAAQSAAFQIERDTLLAVLRSLGE